MSERSRVTVSLPRVRDTGIATVRQLSQLLVGARLTVCGAALPTCTVIVRDCEPEALPATALA